MVYNSLLNGSAGGIREFDDLVSTYRDCGPRTALVLSRAAGQEPGQSSERKHLERSASSSTVGRDATDDEETERRLQAYMEWLALQPPRWENAWLAADRVAPTSALLRWAAARDEDTEVTGYRVFVDDTLAATVPGDTTSHEVSGLVPGRSCRFSVEAGDANGNWSEDGPILEIATPVEGVVADTEPPTWIDASLRVTEVTQNSVRLEWSGAVDGGVGIAAYRVFRHGQVIEEIGASGEHSATITGLASGTFYTFAVEAGDALGHWSANGPSVTVRTELDPEPGRPVRAYTLVIGDDAGAGGAFSELSRATLGKPFEAEGASDVVESILEVIEQVVDSTPPTPLLPENIYVRATSSDGAVVTFSASATDDVDGVLTVTCTPESGSVFPVGETVVVCNATDSAGNLAEGSFRVTVEPPYTPTPTLTHTPTPSRTVTLTPSRTPTSEGCRFVWEDVQGMLSARGYTSAVVERGKVYVVGGASSPVGQQFRNEVATVEAYDPVLDQWERLPDMTMGRVGPAVAALDGRVYAFGGFNGPLTWSANRSAEVYDIEERRWRRIADMPTGRSWMGAAVVGGKIYVIGGVGYGYRRDVEVYDPATDRWEVKTALPGRERYLHAVVETGGKIYVIGGDSWERGYDEVWGDVWEYDPAVDRWVERSSMPSPATGLHAVAWGGRIYVTGGQWVRVYDITRDRWEEWPSDHGGDGSSSLVLWNGWMYRFGGGGWGPTLNIAQRSTLSCPPGTLCTGDCSGDGVVTIDEIVTMVNVAMGITNVSACRAGDANRDGEITVDEIIAAVNKALNGC